MSAALDSLDLGDILVNTTSVGLRSDESPVPAESLKRNTVVMDAVYAPPETRLLRDAKRAGARTVGGKWMLVHQAAVDWTSGTEFDTATGRPTRSSTGRSARSSPTMAASSQAMSFFSSSRRTIGSFSAPGS